jgi:hypothetical protein
MAGEAPTSAKEQCEGTTRGFHALTDLINVSQELDDVPLREVTGNLGDVVGVDLAG